MYLPLPTVLSNRPFYSCVLSYRPVNVSEAGGDLALIQTSLLFSFKCKLVSIKLDLHNKSSEVCIKTRSPAASLPFKGQVTEQTTVKWSIVSQNAVCSDQVKLKNVETYSRCCLHYHNYKRLCVNIVVTLQHDITSEIKRNITNHLKNPHSSEEKRMKP